MPLPKNVVLLSLNIQPWFDEMYDALLTSLRSKAHVERAEDANAAVRLVGQEPPPTAVLVTDEALTLAENGGVWDETLDYVRRGGTVVLMGLFPSFVQPDRMKLFFTRAGLDWEVGSYQRTTTVLNPAAVGAALADKLPPRYSPKTVAVQRVAPAHMWYRHDPEESKTKESPVVLADVGNGKLGYVGDVNAEKASDAVILAMCGLL